MGKGKAGYINLLGCCNKVPQTQWLIQQKFIALQFCQLEVQKQGDGRFSSFEKL